MCRCVDGRVPFSKTLRMWPVWWPRLHYQYSYDSLPLTMNPFHFVVVHRSYCHWTLPGAVCVCVCVTQSDISKMCVNICAHFNKFDWHGLALRCLPISAGYPVDPNGPGRAHRRALTAFVHFRPVAFDRLNLRLMMVMTTMACLNLTRVMLTSLIVC